MQDETRIVFMFSGMGSQFYLMGQELFAKDPVFARFMKDYDQRVIARCGESILESIYQASATRYQSITPLARGAAALLTIECSLAKTLIERGIKPDLMIGASLGETAAGIVAGALDFEEMLELFAEHTATVEAVCAGASLLGIMCSESVLSADSFLRECCEIAAYNFDGYLVAAVKERQRDEVLSHLQKRGIICQPLGIELGFHSSIVDPAERLCKDAAGRIHRNPPTIPILSSATGELVRDFDAEHFWTVLRKPIFFQRTLSKLKSQGPALCIDVGPSGTLATYAQNILTATPQIRVLPILTMFGRDVTNLAKLEQYMNEHKKPVPMEKTALLFPGQGAQRKGMGQELFDAFPKEVQEASAILGYDLKELCLRDPQRQLGLTQYTQPALFVVSALSYLHYRQKSGAEPTFAAGHSLGEYNALFAAGVFDFATGVKLVKKRGELMAAANGGAMAAVLGMTEEKISSLLAREGLHGLTLANLNTPQQTVISGDRSELERAGTSFEAAGARFIPLAVSAAFHSRQMEPAARAFAEYLKSVTLQPPRFPVLSNVSAQPHVANEIAANLAAQLSSPVRWRETVQYLRAKGVTRFEELGVGQVLTRMLSEIPESPPQAQPDAPPPIAVVPQSAPRMQTAGSRLGSAAFRDEYGVAYSYLAGPLDDGISGVQMLSRLSDAGILGVYGATGQSDRQLEQTLQALQGKKGCFAVDLRAGSTNLQRIELLRKHQVRVLHASDFVQLTPALVYYRLQGARRGPDGQVFAPNRIIARISRLETAENFLAPLPARMVAELVASGLLSPSEAELAPLIAPASDLCLRSDGAGPVEPGNAAAMLPLLLRQRATRRHRFETAEPRLGLAGGIGSPESAAAAFLIGADFICTESINQCTVEAETSELVKELLMAAQIHDTGYVPDSSRFELGGRAQVLRRGLLFTARANMLQDLYRAQHSLAGIDADLRRQIEERWFGEPLEAVLARQLSLSAHAERQGFGETAKAEMALVVRAYLDKAKELARAGVREQKSQFHIPCSPAMGAANAWLQETPLRDWRQRHVDELAIRLLDEAARFFSERLAVHENLSAAPSHAAVVKPPVRTWQPTGASLAARLG